MTTPAHELLEKLGLTIRTSGPNGIYPKTEEGPADGFAYFASPKSGQIRFGIQGVPRKKLPPQVLEALAQHGFTPTNQRWETVIFLDDTSAASLDEARQAMATLQQVLDGIPAEGAEAASNGDVSAFQEAFTEFKSLVKSASGHAFENFQSGLPAAWEAYKPKLRSLALARLKPESWSENDIGSGNSLEATIAAIEIQKTTSQILNNNLVFWQNRYGHANRDHRRLLEARDDDKARQAIERQLFELYVADGDEGLIFDRLADLTDRKYPLLAYLFFLRDDTRFMPIQPTTFDRSFEALNIPLKTRGECSWENYSAFNRALAHLQGLLQTEAGLAEVALIDAHSFAWMLISIADTIRKAEDAGRTVDGGGHVYGDRQIAVYEMAQSVKKTVAQSNGQTEERTVKNKELRMTPVRLEEEITRLLDLQGNTCALTGISLQFAKSVQDDQLRPSLDRIDSDGHYEFGNLQVVARFIQFWKGATPNDEFLRQLAVLREHDQRMAEAE